MEPNIDFDSMRLSRRMTADKAALLAGCPDYLSTGFPAIDACLGGGLAPSLTVLGAVSSLGKSTLLLQIAQNIAGTGKPVLFFSLEMTAGRLAEKSVLRQLGITAAPGETVDPDLLTSRDKLARYMGTAAGWERLSQAIGTFSAETGCLYIVDRDADTAPFTVQKIRRYVKAFLAQHREPPVVIVDYLQLLRSSDPHFSGTERQLIDQNIAALWQLAHQGGARTPVIAVSSVNRESYRSPISFASFKESGGIEFSADIVLGLQYRNVRDKHFDPEAEAERSPRALELIVLKNRFGPGMRRCYLDFVPSCSLFYEAAQQPHGSSPAPNPRRYAAVPDEISEIL